MYNDINVDNAQYAHTQMKISKYNFSILASLRDIHIRIV